MDIEKYFNLLVENMFENLAKSIDNIDKDGKTSIVFYFSTLELLFKARLFKEHWSFILDNIDNGKANINNLKNGDFYTVTFEKAASRIHNLCQDLDKDYEKHFDSIRILRNRLVHFDCVSNSSKELTAENISKTWYYVYKLLNDKWKDIFKDYSNKIDKINEKMQSYSTHFWNSKKKVLIDNNRKKYEGNPSYRIIKIDDKELTCNLCNLSLNISNNDSNDISFLSTSFDISSYTLIEKCDICEHEESIFLLSEYLRNSNEISSIEREFQKLINNNLWERNNTVNRSHYGLLINANSSDIDIEFDEILDYNYEDFEVETSAQDENKSIINLKFYKDFCLGDDLFPYYYVLYVDLNFILAIKQDEISKSTFETLYNSIENVNIKFSIDSDGC
jgi:hypothetical protein